MNILIKIRELANLTNSEKELADYILANPRKTLQFKPKELATAAFISTATIYRLINKLGLNGIGELKIEIASSLRESTEEKEINYDYPILGSDTPYQIYKVYAASANLFFAQNFRFQMQ